MFIKNDFCITDTLSVPLARMLLDSESHLAFLKITFALNTCDLSIALSCELCELSGLNSIILIDSA